MHIASSDSNLVLFAPGRYDAGAGTIDVFVPNGSIDALAYVQALEDTTGTVVVTASAPGFANGNSTVDVLAPYFRLNSLTGTIDTLDPVDPFTVSVGLPNGAFTTLSPTQQARGGGPGIAALLTSSDSTVGMLETLTEFNDTVSVYIAPGETTSPSSVGLSGVAFDGVGAGVSQVTAVIPGFAPVSTGIVDVTVTQPTISFTNQPSLGLGAGLQPTLKYRAALSASQHGGVTVHIETPDTALGLISLDGTSVGGSSIDIFLPNGPSQRGVLYAGDGGHDRRH